MYSETLLISKEDIKTCIDMPACLNITESVFTDHGQDNVVMPSKLHLEIPDKEGWANAMPAYLISQNSAGLKWVGGWTRNRKKGLPFIMAEIFLIDPETGILKAVMDGGYITDLRTGAATGIAAKYLAKKQSKTIAIIGAGNQARMQLRALQHIFDLEEIRVADIFEEAAKNFAKEMHQELNIPVLVANDPRKAVSKADIIVTVTTANEILIKREWITDGTFIASLGSYTELDPEIVLNADKLLVDNLDQSRHRGELAPLIAKGFLDEKSIYGEIGEAVAGQKPGRETDKEIIVACMIGLGSVDIGCANYVFTKSRERGIGKLFDFKQSV
jgi:ornithine cyclodeaminase/alanine dehydrogenase